MNFYATKNRCLLWCNSGQDIVKIAQCHQFKADLVSGALLINP
ncbi:hypothetical protein AO375_0750 [Moraxella catarrhalis]|nr:hypothetical protein AO375_0750 [Moraxella catarrhalis]